MKKFVIFWGPHESNMFLKLFLTSKYKIFVRFFYYHLFFMKILNVFRKKVSRSSEVSASYNFTTFFTSPKFFNYSMKVYNENTLIFKDKIFVASMILNTDSNCSSTDSYGKYVLKIWGSWVFMKLHMK